MATTTQTNPCVGCPYAIGAEGCSLEAEDYCHRCPQHEKEDKKAEAKINFEAVETD